MSSDPLSVAIEAAVQRAVAAQLPSIIEAVQSATVTPPIPPPQPEDRLVRTAEAARLIGVNRATIWKWEKDGKLPPRRRIGTTAGYLLSDIKKIQQGEAA
jgi:predicted DNA-binding transcriptional regulator AlpA